MHVPDSCAVSIRGEYFRPVRVEPHDPAAGPLKPCEKLRCCRTLTGTYRSHASDKGEGRESESSCDRWIAPVNRMQPVFATTRVLHCSPSSEDFDSIQRRRYVMTLISCWCAGCLHAVAEVSA